MRGKRLAKELVITAIHVVVYCVAVLALMALYAGRATG